MDPMGNDPMALPAASCLCYHPVNNPGASSGAFAYDNKNERSKLRGIQPERQGLMNESQNPAARGSAGALSRPGKIAPQQILVVEDDHCIRQLNSEVLLNAGYLVDAAEDGAVAWDILQLKGYDLLITDNEMPKVSGIELLKMLHGARLDLPVIMATGTPPTAEFTRHPGLQPAVTLLKPYTFSELLSAVEEALRVTASPREQIAPKAQWQNQPPADGLRR
jgi:CheY-like chemotaxis protein